MYSHSQSDSFTTPRSLLPLNLLSKFLCQISSNYGFGSIPHHLPEFVVFLIVSNLALLLT